MDGYSSDCFERSGEFFNPMMTVGTQISCLLVISHFFQLVLKPLGQPSPLAQTLAGFVLGPSCLSHVESIKTFFFYKSTDYYETMALCSRIMIMFLIGLEIDFPYLRRHLRVASIIACASSFVCTVFAIAVTAFIFEATEAQGSKPIMTLILAIILSNTASPFVTRLAHDLKFANTDLGRLAISSSLVADAYAVFLLILLSRTKDGFNFSDWLLRGFLYLLIIVTTVVLNIHLANLLNTRRRNQKYLRNTELCGLIAILLVAASSLETMGFSSIFACFVVGAMFPRGGKVGRTLLTKLTYGVHNFVLPFYFGYTGFKADVSKVNTFRNFSLVAIVLLLSIGGKVTGILVACLHLKIPLNEGVILAFLMNLKGHVDLLALTVGFEDKVMSGQLFFNLMNSAVVINTLIWGPLIAYMVRRESDILGYKHTAFESQCPESELKLLACVHSPRPVATMIGLIATCKGPESVAITPYLMHLVELPENNKSKILLYHQKEEQEAGDDDNYGGNDVVEINEAVDIFCAQTGMMIHQTKVVASYATMYTDVCDFAEDARASIIILSFHKHQRIDGKLENGKEGARITNQKILLNAKCSVAILIDRGLTAGSMHTSEWGSLQHIAMLFFGGQDDREALGLSRRLGMHHHINLTVIRFLHKSVPKETVGISVDRNEEDILMAIPSLEWEDDADNTVLTEFFNRFVTTGQAGYIMKHVENGEETASALRDMADMYSLFIIGKGSGGHSRLTTGICDWEECPELGKIDIEFEAPQPDRFKRFTNRFSETKSDLELGASEKCGKVVRLMYNWCFQLRQLEIRGRMFVESEDDLVAGFEWREAVVR